MEYTTLLDALPSLLRHLQRGFIIPDPGTLDILNIAPSQMHFLLAQLIINGSLTIS